MYIYAEYLLLENLVINYIILYVTKKFTKINTSITRLLIASVIGALYTLIVFFPSFEVFSGFVVKFTVSMLMIIIAFNPAKFNKFIKLIATFYVVSFIFAGAALAFFYFTETNIISGKGIFYIGNFSVKILAISIIVSWVLIRFTWGYIQGKISRSRMLIPITVQFKNKSIDLMALLDTGNSLKDPITEIPVIVVQFSAIKDLLPYDIQNIFTRYNENNLKVISEVMNDLKADINFRVIPYKSLGKDNGLLLGFKPDTVIINEDDEPKEIKEIIIGIYNNRLSNDDKYMALLHPEVLN